MSWIHRTVALCAVAAACPALAVPPTGAGAVDVNVTNPSLPVAVQTPVDVGSLPPIELAPGQTVDSAPPLVPGSPIALGLQCASEEVNGVRCEIENPLGMVVTHVSVNPNLTPLADSTMCFANVGVGPTVVAHSWLATQPDATQIVLPFGIPTSDARRPAVFVSKRWDVTKACYVFVTFHGYRPPSAAPLTEDALGALEPSTLE